MSIGMLFKVFSDCCVCFAILGAFPTVIPYSYPLLFPALLCGGAAGLAAFLRAKGRPLLSRLCAALPLLSLLCADGIGEMVILIPVIVYTVTVILRGRLQLEYYSFRQYFLRTLLLLGGLYVVLSAFSYIEGMTVYEEKFISAAPVLRYGLVHLLCGVILQRQLRLGMDSRARGGGRQLAAVLGGTGVVLLGFTAAEPLLRQGAATAFKTLFSLFFGAGIAAVEGIGALIDQVEVGAMQEEINQLREDRLPAQMGNLGEQIQQVTSSEEATRPLWWLALVAAVLLAAMILMFLSFRKKSGEVHSAETVAAVEVPRENKPTRRSNRGKVRQLYREFLRQEKKRGLKLRTDYTSGDILARISDDTNQAAAAELREIYLRARYDEQTDISRAQVDAAKEALKKSRSKAS